MKRFYLLLSLIVLSLFQTVFANEPDSAYVFSYATVKNNGSNGLHYAWSTDKKNWHGIGPEYRFLFSDFGRWGSQKRLITPYVFLDQKEQWHCIWTLNEDVGQFAHAATSDLFTWGRQAYPYVMDKGNVLLPEISFQTGSGNYLISWLSDQDGSQKVYKTTTTDFKTYTTTVEGSESDRLNDRVVVMIDGEKQTGIIQKTSWKTIDGLIKHYEWSQYHEQQRNESLSEDSQRFKSLKALDAEISIDLEKSKSISDLLIGIFFEDINYAADGGLYAELVQNRGFEYALSDREGHDKNWNSTTAWNFTGDKNSFNIDTVTPIHFNQKHYAVLSIKKQGEALVNEGFDGIPLKAGDKYNFSVFVRGLNGAKGKLLIRLVDENGKVYAEAFSKSISADWKKQEFVIIANGDCDKTHLEIVPQFTGKVALDMVSLFPKNTFKGRKNGLRADLAQTIADIHPRFIRFPGGCVAHGDGLDNIYRWKNTIGPLEARMPQRNIWGYHQTAGLGYFEYFQYCEDTGAEPLPVLAAGVPCQNSATGGDGQQGGIPMCDMGDYVQEILDLIEWANGDKNTTWGKRRAEAGHPQPFNLKYIGIGNEDLITDIFEERFTMIFKAIQEKYPEITVIGTVGPTYMGTDYREGWELAAKLNVPMVDEHYYQSPGWFLNNQNYYDKYDRSKPKVYLGEYAAHIAGRKMNIETALCEALHLSNVERNGDVVRMTSFAPLLAKEGHTQWNPDLIYFNNTEVKPTVDYYIQKLYGQNSGDEYIPSTITLSDNRKELKKRIISSLVHDSKTGDYILKLTNLLPVEVNSTINLEQLQIKETEAVVTILKGELINENCTPVKSSMVINKQFNYHIPAHSFSIIRIKSE